MECYPERIGLLGGLIPVATATSAEETYDSSRYTLATTVEGVQIAYFQPRRPGPRSWAVSTSATAYGDHDYMQALATGVRGRGPWLYVPGEAQVTNVLTPAQSAGKGLQHEAYTVGGHVSIGDVHLPSSVVSKVPTAWQPMFDYVPLVPGLPATVSLWAQSAEATPNMTVAMRSGGSLLLADTVNGSSGSMWQHLVWSIPEVPPGVDSVRFGVRVGTSRVAGAQVTWTAEERPYAAGRTASEVVVEKASIDVVGMSRRTLYGSSSWTIREVGNAGW